MTVTHRLKQGVRALLSFAKQVDDDLVASVLNAAQVNYFKQMTRSEQLHSIRVLRSIRAQADNTPHDLDVAALMHDVGKSRYTQNITHKTVSVLVKKFLPKLEERLTQDETLTFWRAPFVVRRYHPKWSGEILSETGASERAIWLASHHQDNAEDWRDHPYYPLLKRLQAADDTN